MALTAWLRSLGVLAFVLVSLTCAAHAQFPLALESKVVEIGEPKVVAIGKEATLTVISNGTINLSGVTKQQVIFFDLSPLAVGQPINIGTRKLEATARRLTVTAGIDDATRALGEQQMHIVFGDAIVSLKFTLVPPFVCPASCQLPRICVNKKCVLPPTKCNPRCPVDQFCNEERKRCEKRPPG
jgi:hypothetical protein